MMTLLTLWCTVLRAVEILRRAAMHHLATVHDDDGVAVLGLADILCCDDLRSACPLDAPKLAPQLLAQQRVADGVEAALVALPVVLGAILDARREVHAAARPRRPLGDPALAPVLHEVPQGFTALGDGDGPRRGGLQVLWAAVEPGRVAGEEVLINGKVVAKGLPLVDKSKVSTKAFERDEVIPEGKVFMTGTHPLSNDSRYWGYLDLTAVVGKGYKIF